MIWESGDLILGLGLLVAENMVVNSIGTGVRLGSHPCAPWKSGLAFLSCHFLVCKM